MNEQVAGGKVQVHVDTPEAGVIKSRFQVRTRVLFHIENDAGGIGAAVFQRIADVAVIPEP